MVPQILAGFLLDSGSSQVYQYRCWGFITANNPFTNAFMLIPGLYGVKNASTSPFVDSVGRRSRGGCCGSLLSRFITFPFFHDNQIGPLCHMLCHVN